MTAEDIQSLIQQSVENDVSKKILIRLSELPEASEQAVYGSIPTISSQQVHHSAVTKSPVSAERPTRLSLITIHK